MGSQLFGYLTLAVIGVIIADVLIHPAGVRAAGGVGNKALGSTYNALLGHAV